MQDARFGAGGKYGTGGKEASLRRANGGINRVFFFALAPGYSTLVVCCYYWYVVHICVAEPKNQMPHMLFAGPHGRYAR